MSNTIIAKILVFVILVSACSSLFSGCSSVSSGTAKKPAVSSFEAPGVTGTIASSDITESSGLAASPCQDGVLWTHNDSGDEAVIYALNRAGNSLGKWKIPDAQNIDWEDIAAQKDRQGKCFLYIGEIGDNKEKRPEHIVYRVAEPTVNPAAPSASRNDPLTTAEAEVLRFSYPDDNQDAETLMVHPRTGEIYVVTKRVSGPAGVYRIKPEFGSLTTQKAVFVAAMSVPAIPNGFLTGGDISQDGTRLTICDYSQAYEFSLPAGETDFAKIWVQEPETIDLGKRKGGESVGYSSDGNSLFATSEGKNSPVIEVRRRGY